MSAPYFTIVIPTYNRARLLPRALASCFAQDFPGFEVVVVDSASTDGTPELVRSYDDPRVRLIEEPTRRGVCPARNVAVDAAAGQWVVLLDSDDEMPPGTLSLMHRLIGASPSDVAQLRFMCLWDDGRQTPIPPLRDEVWGYEEYLRFLDRCDGGYTETMSCIRADTFAVVRFPEDRSYEMLYHLDFARRFRTRTVPAVARLYHTDAADQNTFVPNTAHWRRVAPDQARSFDTILREHGSALRRQAPRSYVLKHRLAAKFHFLSGNRSGGLRYLSVYLRSRPWSLLGWGILIFGLLGPGPLGWLDAAKMRARLSLRALLPLARRRDSDAPSAVAYLAESA
jgi:glycosyltransferase involved in cell wall biosynthesis